MPINGKAWQAMRLNRNRNWGHPKLIALLKRFALEAQEHDGWPGLLIGDLAQPRGGPMLSGHRSHQVGLDADIWFMQMPKRRLSYAERKNMSAISMLSKNRRAINKKRWTKAHVKLIKRIASYREVQRVIVHPVIKKALCKGAGELGGRRAWLNKVRPWWGHHYHFHVRIFCPPGSVGCRPQPPTPRGNTCGTELKDWLARVFRRRCEKPLRICVPGEKITRRCQCKCAKKLRFCRKGEKITGACQCRKRPRRRRPITLAQLPQACRAVLKAPDIGALKAKKAIPPLPVRRSAP